MFLRALAVITLIIGLLALAVLGPRWLMSGGTGENSGDLEACQVLEQVCSWENEGRKWSVALARTEAGADGDTLELVVTADNAPERLLAVLRGESMYLGEYPVALKATGNGTWRATFTAPFCTVEPDMTWRIDLQSGQERLEGVPFRLLFRASGEH